MPLATKIISEERVCSRFDVPSSGPVRVANTADHHTCSPGRVPAVAILTPYSGNNLGDAAIQDALIANLRARLGSVQFSGITLNCDNFLERHGEKAFPLCGTSRPFYGMAAPEHLTAAESNSTTSPLKAVLKKLCSYVPFTTRAYRLFRALRQEYRHFVAGCEFLRGHDLLIASGGGQLDEEWGGPWGLPLSLLKWSLIAKRSKVPFVIASVGAGKVESRWSRIFLRAALKRCSYRSYRDEHSRQVARKLIQVETDDVVVPDLALGVTASTTPAASQVHRLARRRRIVAISPIAYAKPGCWPHEDALVYRRYVDEMAKAVREFVNRGYFVVLMVSALSDRAVIGELQQSVNAMATNGSSEQIYAPSIESWRDVVGSLKSVDLLIASRLHSIILGCATHRPVVAVSFDPKVNRMMADLAMSEHLLNIEEFVASDIMKASDRVARESASLQEKMIAYQLQARSALGKQYDSLARMIVDGDGVGHKC